MIREIAANLFPKMEISRILFFLTNDLYPMNLFGALLYPKGKFFF
jgi:hypothetical protein